MFKFCSLLLITLALCSWANGLGEFVARCPNNRRAEDDPLVYPSEPGKSHMHDFFGAEGVNAFSTPTSMRNSATGCNPSLDHSSYWTPTLIHNGVYYAPYRTTFYYHAFNNHNQVQPIPLGLQMISRNGHFTCFGGNRQQNPQDPAIPHCVGGELEMFVNFPQCWNGVDLNSPDFTSHVAFQQNGNCPPGFPVQIPRVQIKFNFAVEGGPGTSLSSGDGLTAHADFVNGWENQAMLLRVNECLRKDEKCPENLPGDEGINPVLETQTPPSNTVPPPSTPPTKPAEDPEEPEPEPLPTGIETPEGAFVFSVIADAFVRGGQYGGQNFGENIELNVKKGDNPDFQREVYMKFNLNNAPSSISSCILRIQVDSGISPITEFNFKLGTSSSNWEEMTLTSDNAPSSTFIESIRREEGEQVIEIDVLEQCRNAIESDGLLSFHIYQDEGGITENIYFLSRESGDITSPKIIALEGENIELKDNSAPTIVFSFTTLLLIIIFITL